jgi:hypothetical protein
MAKKALISTLEPRGKDNSGFRVVEVVDAANIFEVHSNLQWKDCADTVERDLYWYDPSVSSFKKMPEAVDKYVLGKLKLDEEGMPIEKYEWNWDTETWSIQVL